MTPFQIKLIEIQNEQKELIASGNRRKKITRERIQFLTKKFYDVKAEWRSYNQQNGIVI